GDSGTAPPPERRRATDTPARAARAGSTTVAGWVDPRTTAGDTARHTATARRPGVDSTRGQAAWRADAEPRRCSTIQESIGAASHRLRRGARLAGCPAA